MMGGYRSVSFIALLVAGSAMADTSAQYDFDPNNYQSNTVAGSSSAYSQDYAVQDDGYANFAPADGDQYYNNDPYGAYDDTQKNEINFDPFGLFSNTNRQGGLESITILPIVVAVFAASMVGSVIGPLFETGLKRMVEGFELPKLNLPRIRYIVESEDSDSAFESLPWVVALEENADNTSSKVADDDAVAETEARGAGYNKRWVK